jgi:hypothetical protein|tara:strand:+ start:5357 stop:5965 length:609 start_codon:yes stop_codon:yes gene_type:complete
MTICHEKRLIFIHIPKNAGTSIIKAMGVENIYMDKTIEEYKEHYNEYWDKYKKFTVVRDPIDRFISAYKFARMKESGWFSATGEEGLEKHTHYELCNSMDINEYSSYIYKNPKEFNRWIIPQTFLISNENKEIEIDYYVRYENLLEDLKKIGIDSIEKLNSSKIEDDKVIQLTRKSKNMLHEIYDVDYQNFDYKKELLFKYS